MKYILRFFCITFVRFVEITLFRQLHTHGAKEKELSNWTVLNKFSFKSALLFECNISKEHKKTRQHIAQSIFSALFSLDPLNIQCTILYSICERNGL